MGGRVAEGVEGGDGGRLLAPGQHVPLGGVTREPHVREGGRAQEVGDKLELLDGGDGLEKDSTAQ